MDVWIWDDEREKFRIIDDSRCDFNYRHNSKQNVYTIINAKTKAWKYYAYGYTKKECWINATVYLREEIEKTAKKLDELNKLNTTFGKCPE